MCVFAFVTEHSLMTSPRPMSFSRAQASHVLISFTVLLRTPETGKLAVQYSGSQNPKIGGRASLDQLPPTVSLAYGSELKFQSGHSVGSQ